MEEEVVVVEEEGEKGGETEERGKRSLITNINSEELGGTDPSMRFLLPCVR